MSTRAAPLLLGAIAALAGCNGESTLSGPCSLSETCDSGQVCDFTAEGGAICISASGDVDGDGIPNDKDFCQHAMGGATDEDQDGIGDDCDKCPIAPPFSSPDPDGDDVESPCDPDPHEPGDQILLFDGFLNGLDPRWKATTESAWTIKPGELVANLSAVTEQDYFQTNVVGKSSVSIVASYRVDRLEASATEHKVAVFLDDPRPAGVANVSCGVTKADSGTSELVLVETNQSAMNQIVTGAFDSARLYRAGAYVTGTKGGCAVLADQNPLGTVQAQITPDQLSSVALTARAVTVRFQWVLVVGR